MQIRQWLKKHILLEIKINSILFQKIKVLALKKEMGIKLLQRKLLKPENKTNLIRPQKVSCQILFLKINRIQILPVLL
ncbi:hypothetical protein D3C85_1385190 [compost metagenome]